MTSMWNWLRFLPPSLSCRVQASSLTGRRAENQDNYLVIAPNAAGQVTARWLQEGKHQEAKRSNWSSRWVRLALMDGMGGHAKGREIAETAAIELRDLPPCTSLKKQRRILLDLHHGLQAHFANGHSHSPGTTIIWAEIDLHHRICNLLHVGDSRAWLWNGQVWQKLTWDHSPLEFQFRDGRIEAAEYLARVEQPENRIVQALGYGYFGVRKDAEGNDIFGFDSQLRLDTAASLPSYAQDHADIVSVGLSPGALVLLSSDGLWNSTPVRLPDPSAIVTDTTQTLAQEAINAGSRDNTTLVLGVFA